MNSPTGIYWWQFAEKHPAWPAFVRCLGGDEITAKISRVGWDWFVEGWKAKHAEADSLPKERGGEIPLDEIHPY